MSTRRQFLRSSGAALLTAGLVSKVQAASLPEAPIQASPLTQPPLAPPNGRQSILRIKETIMFNAIWR